MGLLNPTIKMAKRLVMRLLVVWLVFSLSILASRSLPGDPVRLYMSTESSKGTSAQFQERYLEVAARYHLDKPLFYLSVLPISSRNLRDFSLDLNYSPSQKRFIQEYEWPESQLFLEFAKKQSLADPENSFWKQQVENPKPENCPPDLTISLPQRIPVWQKLIPIILWNGFDNQYHLSIMSFFKGDWGVSIKSGEPVWTRIKRSVGWTLALNIPALLLAAGISVFLGVFLARKEGSGPARWLEALLPIGFAIPVFVLAIVCMQIFQWLGIPLGESSMGKGYSLGGTLANYIQTAAIPIVCMVIPAIGFLSRQVKLSFQAELARPYTTYLWLRGVSAMRVYWFYIFKNALITLSTDIGRLITSMVSGLLLVEIVFNIPGMGRLLYEAIWSRDWPVLNAVLWVSTVLAVVGLMIADLIVYGATRKKSNPI